MSRPKYAVVTGASSGIGAATALLLAGNGFHVLAAARRIDRLNELAAKHANIETIALHEILCTKQGRPVDYRFL